MPYLYVCAKKRRARVGERQGREKRRGTGKMRESMVKAAKSKENEEGHGSSQIRMCDREKMYEDYGRKCVE